MPKPARIDSVSRALGKRLRSLREAAELTQDELGRRAKLSPKFLSAVENGHTNASIGVVARLSAGLGLPLSTLFSTDPPAEVVDDLGAITALVGAQPALARRRALRVLRALFDD